MSWEISIYIADTYSGMTPSVMSEPIVLPSFKSRKQIYFLSPRSEPAPVPNEINLFQGVWENYFLMK